MASNRLESTGGTGEAAKPAAVAEAAAPSASGGGAKAWIPLIATIVAMPLLAFATTNYLLLPKLKQSLGANGPETPAAAPAKPGGTSSHGGEAAAKPGAQGGGGEAATAEGKAKEAAQPKTKFHAQLNKIIVNVAGTMGTRFLVVNLTCVSRVSSFEEDFKENEPEIRHVTISCLSSKAITDLEKPGAKNVIRSELISLYNSVLGNGVIQEIYFTDFAIQ
jgi:flagellar FliL protein